MSNLDIAAFHPGYYIADAIKDMKISQAEFATRMGITEKTLSELINGRVNISNDLAKKLSVMMGTSPEVWLNLQNTYDQKLIEIVQDYKVLSYYSEEDGCYLAQIPEFAGCIADGSTPEEAIKNVKDLGKEWIELAIEDGKPIPAPTCNNLANITTEEEDHATELP